MREIILCTCIDRLQARATTRAYATYSRAFIMFVCMNIGRRRLSDKAWRQAGRPIVVRARSMTE